MARVSLTGKPLSASAAAGEVQRQADEAVGEALGPVCDGLNQAENSLSALAAGKAETVAEAKQQIADAQADLTDGSAAGAIASEAVVAGVSSALDGLAQSLAPHRDDNLKPLRLIIMGIPNVGKSTLMNALLKRKVAKVGDEPAVTKHQQTLDLGPGMTLTDTPGMMWPKIDHDADGYMLAASHAIGRNAVIDEEVAAFLGEILIARYPDRLAVRYRLDAAAMAALDGPALVEAVGRRRGCLVKGGGLDLEKAAQILLQDYRDGALGRISLETPETRAHMIAAAQAAAAQAAAAGETAEEAAGAAEAGGEADASGGEGD